MKKNSQIYSYQPFNKDSFKNDSLNEPLGRKKLPYLMILCGVMLLLFIIAPVYFLCDFGFVKPGERVVVKIEYQYQVKDDGDFYFGYKDDIFHYDKMINVKFYDDVILKDGKQVNIEVSYFIYNSQQLEVHKLFKSQENLNLYVKYSIKNDIRQKVSKMGIEDFAIFTISDNNKITIPSIGDVKFLIFV